MVETRRYAKHSENDLVKQLFLSARKDQDWQFQLSILVLLSEHFSYQPMDSIERTLLAIIKRDLPAIIDEGVNGAEIFSRWFADRTEKLRLDLKRDGAREDNNEFLIREIESEHETVKTLLERYLTEISADALRDITSMPFSIDLSYGELIVVEAHEDEAYSGHILGPGPLWVPEQRWRADTKTIPFSDLINLARSELERRSRK